MDCNDLERDVTAVYRRDQACGSCGGGALCEGTDSHPLSRSIAKDRRFNQQMCRAICYPASDEALPHLIADRDTDDLLVGQAISPIVSFVGRTARAIEALPDPSAWSWAFKR